MALSPKIRKCFNFGKIFTLTLGVTISFVLISTSWFTRGSEEQPEDVDKLVKLTTAGVLLTVLYLLIIFELVDRTLAAMIGAAMSIAAHVYLIDHVSMGQIVSWLDLETLSLLFGMMIISSILSLSGVLDFAAIWCYKKSSGRFWLLIGSLSLVTAFLSALIDNVSTMLLLTPTLIKLSELERLDSRYLLMIMVMMSNIGGGATPVGDPPNLIIISDPLTRKLNITFGSFVFYAAPGLLAIVASILIYLKVVYKSREGFAFKSAKNKNNNNNSSSNQRNQLARLHSINKPASVIENELELLGELKMLKLFEKELYQFGDKLIGSSESDSVRVKIKSQTEHIIKGLEMKFAGGNVSQIDPRIAADEDDNRRRHETTANVATAAFHREPDEQSATIKSKSILVQSLLVLLIAVLLFVLHPSLANASMSLGGISLFSSLILLVLTSTKDLEGKRHEEGEDDNKQEQSVLEYAIEHVEWNTLIFFAGLFIIMEVLSKLGLIAFLGLKIGQFISLLPGGSLRSIGALSIVLWSSALASALIDNVPITSMLIKILDSMNQNAALDLNMKSLIFALVFGVCCGGNGTLIGASTNLVTSGLSGRHGQPISFNRFLKFCSPVAVLTLIVSNIYLVLVFVVLGL